MVVVVKRTKSNGWNVYVDLVDNNGKARFHFRTDAAKDAFIAAVNAASVARLIIY